MTNERIFLSPPHMLGSEREMLLEAFDSGYVAPAGPMIERFEAAFAEYVGGRYGVALSSGTAALHLALRIVGVGRDDLVAAPTLTFIGGVAAINYQGAAPIFVDADPGDWCMSPKGLEDAFDLAERAGKRIAAVVPTDLYGQACDIDVLQSICDARGAPLVMDSAEAVGALYKGRHAGGGVASAFSFNGNKIITSAGGGMLVTDDKALADRARYLSTAARQPTPHYEHTEVGYNYRLSNLSAAVGLAQLQTIEQRVALRRGIFDTYVARLGGLPGVSFAPEAADRRHSRWLTVMLIEPTVAGVTPEQVRVALEAVNIETRPLWKPMHMQPVFREALRTDCGVAEHLYERGLCLPSGSGMTAADLDRVCAALEQVLGRASAAA